MIDAIGANAASMDVISRQYEAIAHNLANSSTTGFKRTFCMQTSGAGGSSTDPTNVAATMSIDFSQGNFVQTGRPLDLALSGPGFFTLETPKGLFYTRNGTFQTNAQGQLVDVCGRTVAGESGPIVIPAKAPAASITVSKDGRVSAGGATLGKLKIVEFANPQTLTPAGDSAFRASAAPQDAAKTFVQQGYQEGSNVNVVEELVGLITASRTYEANIKAVTSGNERNKSLLQVAMG
jgi:flagellar basal-body rod protein FlgF